MVNASRVARRAGAVAAGLATDRAFGEPAAAVHPVAGFGTLMGAVERRVYADSVAAGARYTALGLAVAAASGRRVPLPAAVALTVAGRELRSAARQVRDALAVGDLDQARALVPALVGRDPSELGHSGLAAAVIESLGENTVDAVVAPALWAVAAGPVGAVVYRAVNTMDAMVGNRSARYAQFGRMSARLDDVANFVPARVTAALVAAVRPRAARQIWRAIRDQAPAHPSPNAGVAEAAFAAALGVELGGPLRYGDRTEVRPRLGWGPRPVPGDIDRAIALASQVELALTGSLIAVALGTLA